MATHGVPIDYRPRRLMALWRTTIGKKYVAAITGVIIAVWVVLHMLGNLKAIEGPGSGHSQAAIDRYAHTLRTLFGPVFPNDMILWIIRGVLIVAVLLHIVAVGQLYVRNRRSQPGRTKRVRATWFARTMPLTGLLILGFLIFHILHFSTRTIHPTKLVNGLIYANMYDAFQKWWLVAIYVGAVTMLGLHLNHGLWSGTQTAGIDNPDRNWFWRRSTNIVTLLTVVGFAVIPILFIAGAFPKPVHG